MRIIDWSSDVLSSDLLDPPAIEDHHGKGKAAIFRAPPARSPIGAALFLERPVAQKGDEALTRQWHMDILHLGKAQIAALGDRAVRVRPGMATKRDRCRPARKSIV